MLGVSEESMAGRPVTDFMFDEDASDHLAKMENRRRGKSEEYERRFRRADGQEVWTHVSAVPIFDDQRRFTGAMGMFTDITERRRAEDALRRRKDELERFERLVVGRELRMRELKDRVGRLEGALAQARRDEDDES
jgi:PAS domain S-box-containing protein